MVRDEIEAMRAAPIDEFTRIVRDSAFQSVRICSVCAIRCGARWQQHDHWNFEQGECPCCGIRGGLTMVSNWKWGDEDAKTIVG